MWCNLTFLAKFVEVGDQNFMLNYALENQKFTFLEVTLPQLEGAWSNIVLSIWRYRNL